MLNRITASKENQQSTKGNHISLYAGRTEYVAKNGIPNAPEDLLNHLCLPLGFFDGDSTWTFTQGERKSVVTVDGRYINNDANMRLRGVRQGFGIAPFPDFVVRDSLEKGCGAGVKRLAIKQ